MKPKIQLAIYEFHASSAAISIDGKIVFACHEDRIVQRKNEIGFPVLSIKKCLEFTKIKPSEIDEVGIINDKNSFKNYDSIVNYIFKRQSRYKIKDWIDENEKYWYPKIYKNKKLKSYFYPMGGKKKIAKDHHIDVSFYNEKKSLNYNIKKLFDKKKELIRKLGINKAEISFIPHYKCHHYHAFYSSPIRNFKNSIIIHAEGDGGKYNQAVSIPTDKGLKFLHGTNSFNLGRLYQWTTLNLKMLPYHDEYKLMGLAPYANRSEANKLFKTLDNFFKLNKKNCTLVFKKKPNDMFYFFKKIFKHYRFDAIAGAVQLILEKNLLELSSFLLKKYKNRNLIFYGGGVAMNVKANLLISNLKGVKNFFVPVSPADESNVIGALYLMIEKDYLKEKKPLQKIQPLETPYLGMNYSFLSKKYLINKFSNYQVTNLNLKKISKNIFMGEIVARFSGRAEFGQRALGNRSILASPIFDGISTRLNNNIKSRDFWMPFAMTVLDTAEKEYFEKNTFVNSKYMTSCFELKKKYYDFFKCGVHPYDNTVRAQILNQKDNKDYYNLIAEFKKISSVGALVNTSFNIHKFPIVETIDDVLHVFKNTNLDKIIIDNFEISKN
ncbi:hypothetical protein N9A57_03110 [Candidatus Pelagibacter sp.]|nr:hypothetical protein [Candidatus Pelagibacter sp.]